MRTRHSTLSALCALRNVIYSQNKNKTVCIAVHYYCLRTQDVRTQEIQCVNALPLTLFLRFVAGLEPGIFCLSTRFKRHTQFPRIRGYRWRFLCSTIFPYEVTRAKLSISHLNVILRTVAGLGQIEEVERQFDFVISVHFYAPDALDRVVVWQRVVVAGQRSSLRH